MAGNTDQKENGIHAWMTSMRTSMANDPCRQLFEDQLQTHAFIFLDDYLEHILAGPKQAPIIELVKTPGRKKDIPRRARVPPATTVQVKSTTSFSSDDDNSSKDVVPVNSFHKVLLQARERSVRNAPEKPRGRSSSVHAGDLIKDTVSVESELHASAMPPQHYHRDPPGEYAAPFPASERGAVLSVIAEGDEPLERSHANILPLSIITSDQQALPETVPRSRHEVEGCPATKGDPDTMRLDREPQEDPSADVRYSVPLSVDTDPSTPVGFREVQSSEAPTGNHTEPLPSQIGTNSPNNRGRHAFTAPLPVVPTSNSISTLLNGSPPRTLAHKSGAVGFPMLPAPSPLRKSMRATQEALAGSALPTVVPAPVPLGKRTSWLMKAREAKAMEGTSTGLGNSAIAIPVAFPRVSTAVKRKSGEMLDALPPRSDRDKEQRRFKVAKSIDVGVVPPTSKEIGNNDQRDCPVQGETAAPSSTAAAISVDHLGSRAMNVDIAHLNPADEGFIDLFKRTVEGLGARAGKSMGKSLGDAAVAALAEARAAAEARVAERNKVDSESSDSEMLLDDGLPSRASFEAQTQLDDRSPFVPAPRPERAERHLSLSDLVSDTVRPHKLEASIEAAWAKDINNSTNDDDESISATPPNSPPSKGSLGFVKPTGPVFNKPPPPPPVFMPPASKQSTMVSGPKEFPSKFPSGQFMLPVAMSLGIPARLTSPSDGFLPLAQGTSHIPGQSSQSGISTDPVFDLREGVPMWIPPTRDSPCTIDSQSREVGSATSVIVDDDDDDSWPLEEKLAAVEPGWRPFDFSNVDKEDTWSSLPTESQGPTRSLIIESNGDRMPDTDIDAGGGSEAEQEPGVVEVSDAERFGMATSEVEEVIDTGITGTNGAEPIARSTSQTSVASAASSRQSQAGFFSQATKLVNSVLGGGKKTKPELKSLQLAAAAAKRQQEEADKKMQRLKDMEARRQVVNAKKAEEERARLLEEERKSKEELEKRKREREENTDRRPVKPLVSSRKTEDDASKKRRFAPEVEKKPESRKPPPKDKKDPVPSMKPAVTPATKLAAQRSAKASSTALVSSAAYNATQNATPAPAGRPVIPEAKPFKVVPSTMKGKAKAKTQEDGMGDQLPSTMVQSQMAARAKAQMQAAKLSAPEVPSESIELPDINSEYSDSEDEDRARTFDPPDWAQSPELRQALQMQSTMNPDDIFGGIRPLRMEEMFRTRQSRFRARTSSANWSGSDRLTIEEIREYERRMGFQQTRTS